MIEEINLVYDRTIRFQDTDAAGVVYFANVLSMCHEAYEESLIKVGIDLRSFFRNHEIAIPIVHAEVDFFKPMMCGDRISIHLTPTLIKESEFDIRYEIRNGATIVSKALTRHVCIDLATRTRKVLSTELMYWLQQASGELENGSSS
jgi:1,4-dihydroxy-2-naphthoyl-CoA hydrolase